jgi:outer membrane protein OmpA-like peptidoglycan-associated protein
MTPPLSRRQSVLLGLVVLAAVGLLGAGLLKLGGKQGLFADRTEVSVRLKDAHDIAPGTTVRVKGIDAGSVTAVEYPDTDGPAAAVTVRMSLDRKYADRLFADATAQAYAPTPLGSKVIAIEPGQPAAGPLAGGELTARETPDLGTVVAKLDATANETQALLKDVRAGKGSLGKLVTDDTLYDDLSGLAKDSRAFLKRADTAVTTVEAKAADVDQVVADSRGVVKSAKQSVDAVQSLPVIRNYVVNADRLLNRPDCTPVVYQYAAADLFQTDSFTLTDEGRGHVTRLGDYLKKLNGKVEVVIAAVGDPKAAETTAGVRLTEQRAAAVLKLLESQKGLKTSWFTSRKASAVGLGNAPSPLGDGPTSADYVQVVMFVPR